MNTTHNARVQLLATALNNLGVGAILAGIIAPLVNGSFADPTHIVVWLFLGTDFMLLAHTTLERLRP